MHLLDYAMSQDKINKLKSAQVLRSHASKSEFIMAAIEVVGLTIILSSRSLIMGNEGHED